MDIETNSYLSGIDFSAASFDAANFRRECLSTGRSIDEVVTIALKCLSVHQEVETIEQLVALLEENTAAPLIAAARTLHSIGSMLLRLPDGLDANIANSLLMHAAVGYAMYGNFASSYAVVREISPSYIRASQARMVCVAICSPRSLGLVLGYEQLEADSQALLQNYQHFLETGEPASLASAENLLKKLMCRPSPADMSLMRSCRVALRQTRILSVAAALGEKESGIPADFSRRLIQSHTYLLLPPQFRLLSQLAFSKLQENALLNLPTSTGKTLIAECAIVARLAKEPGIAVFIAPYITIGHQVADALHRHVPSSIGVERLFGGFQLDSNVGMFNNSTILVATPERFDAWLRSSPAVHRLRIVVADEIHNIGNGSRGIRYEGVITRLRLLQENGATFRLVAMSAVLAAPEAMCHWLNVTSANLFRDSWRPTARHLGVWHADGKLVWIYGNDVLRPKTSDATNVVGFRTLELPIPIQPRFSNFPTSAEQLANHTNVAYLAKNLARTVGKPVLVVCGTKQGTRAIARAIGSGAIQTLEETLSRAEIVKKARELMPWSPDLANLLEIGIAFHNASMPAQMRKEIEDAVRAGRIDYVCATTTLAEGADLPFRTTIIENWIVGYGDDAKPMPSLLFRNIAGRCGRAGAFAEGDTVVYENLIGPWRFTNHSHRKTHFRSVILDPPPVESALMWGVENNGSNDAAIARAALESQIIAAIPENPLDESLAFTVANRLYSNSAAASANLTSICEGVVAGLLAANDEFEPFAVAASPIKLTEIGKAANRTGLSASTCRALLHYLKSLENHSLDLPRLCSEFLLNFGTIPEQQDSYLRKVIANSKQRGFVKSTDLEYVTHAWLARTGMYEAFSLLPTFAKSSANEDTRTKEFDKFIQLVEATWGSFLPWLFRACHQLAPFGAEAASQLDWREMARTLESRGSLEDIEIALVEHSPSE
jgi:helicase